MKSRDKRSHPQFPIMKATEILERQIVVAKRDNTDASAYGVRVTPGGRFYAKNSNCRIGRDDALAEIEKNLAPKVVAAPKAPRGAAGSMTWDKLNNNTKQFFQWLGEQIQEKTHDHGMHTPARIGRNEIALTLQQCPLLTNLKKAGVVYGFVDPEKKSQKWVQLTEEGRAIWHSYFA